MEKRTEALRARNFYIEEDKTNEKIQINVDIDRTIEEQIAHKKLVQKLREMKRTGQQNLRIVNGKIIEIFRPSLQNCWKPLNTTNNVQISTGSS